MGPYDILSPPTSSVFMAIYLISLHLVQHQTRSSTHWKLEPRLGKVVPVDTTQEIPEDEDDDGADNNHFSRLTTLYSIRNNYKKYNELDEEHDADDEIDNSNHYHSHHYHRHKHYDNQQIDRGEDDDEEEESDPIMEILTTKLVDGQGRWSVNLHTQELRNMRRKKLSGFSQSNTSGGQSKKDNSVSCGKTANSTAYDHLKGVLNRHRHPHIAEPEVASLFHKGPENTHLDLVELEKKLMKTRREKPQSIHILNSIGNFWRIKGNTLNAIECFRKVLFHSPGNVDALLNLARLLLQLRYLDDALYLTQTSLNKLPSYQNAWSHHFTLGEIHKFYGHYQKAVYHFKLTLELKPGFDPAKAHLQEVETQPSNTITNCTFLIILLLVFGVLFGVVHSGHKEIGKTQRSFNRAMAMKCLKKQR